MNNGILNKFHSLSTWISNLAYINILWLTFTLLGGVLLGIFPATIAMFFIIKRMFLEKSDFSIIKEFTILYKKEFKKSNLLFFPFILLAIIVAADIRFISSLDFAFNSLVVKLFYVLLFLLAMIFLYSLVVYIYGARGKKEIFKSSLYILFNNPMTNLYILTGLLLLHFLTLKVAGLSLLFSGSVFSLIVLMIVQKTAKKLYS
ncbi:putative membrane protein YesL [Neobacillus sp. B4I6]|uniref:YesL family protein n=1 Tax=Neobacillus sp. B4I6 TaxID=3373925 RepID=UPI003D2012E0